MFMTAVLTIGQRVGDTDKSGQKQTLIDLPVDIVFFRGVNSRLPINEVQNLCWIFDSRCVRSAKSVLSV